MSPHVCDRKCTGENFGGFYIRCTSCQRNSMVECLIKFTGMKKLLKVFGLFDENTEIFTKNEAKMQQIKAIFRNDTPFKFLCEACRVEMENLKTKLQRVEMELEEMKKLLIDAQKDDSFSDAIGTSANENITNAIDRGQNQNNHEIFVSKFPPSTECDAITALILEKTGLEADKFEVIRMVNPKMNIKFCKFMTFKIKAADKPTFDVIIDDKIWTPFAKAIPFNPNEKSDRRLRRERDKNQKKTQEKHPKHQKRHTPIAVHQEPEKKVNKSRGKQDLRSQPQRKTPTLNHDRVKHQDPSRSKPLRMNGRYHQNRNGHRPAADQNGIGRTGYVQDYQRKSRSRNNDGENFRRTNRREHKTRGNDVNVLIDLFREILDKF